MFHVKLFRRATWLIAILWNLANNLVGEQCTQWKSGRLALFRNPQSLDAHVQTVHCAVEWGVVTIMFHVKPDGGAAYPMAKHDPCMSGGIADRGAAHPASRRRRPGNCQPLQRKLRP